MKPSYSTLSTSTYYATTFAVYDHLPYTKILSAEMLRLSRAGGPVLREHNGRLIVLVYHSRLLWVAKTEQEHPTPSDFVYYVT